MDQQIPIEIAIVKAKQDIINCLNAVGQKYQLPGIILSNIVQDIYMDNKLNTYEEAIRAVNIPNDIPDTDDSSIETTD